MSSFTKPLIVTPLNNGLWKLVEPFEYHIGCEGSKEIIRIPNGFITDFASIPKVFWNVIGSPWGRYGKSAVVHDFLYATQIVLRKRADNIFYEGMKVLKVPFWKRWILYWAVRIFGFVAWNKHRKELL